MTKFKVGDKVYVDWFSGDQDYATVVKYNPSNDTYDVRLEGGEIAHPKAKLLISANSRACNSVSTGLKDANGNNLNVGDVVVHTSSRLHGKVVGKYNSYLINVKWEGGFVEECNPDDVRKWSPVGISNSTNAIVRKAMNAARSRNDVLGRYKPGVRVAVELRTRPIVGKVMQYGGRPEVEYSPTTRTRFTGTLIKQNGDKWDIKSDSGEVYKSVSESDFGLSYNSRSRNAVVAKAMNAVARNSLTSQYRDLEKNWSQNANDKLRSVWILGEKTPSGDRVKIKGWINDPVKGRPGVWWVRNLETYDVKAYDESWLMPR